MLDHIDLETCITESQTAHAGAVRKHAPQECISDLLLAGSSAGVLIRIGVKEPARAKRRTISRRHRNGEGIETGAQNNTQSLIREPGSSNAHAQVFLRSQRIMLVHSWIVGNIIYAPSKIAMIHRENNYS